MRYGTVCSGVEAFGPSWEALGLTPVFHAEIAAHPSAVLRYHYPDIPNYGDFTTIHSERIDLLAGGTPCQDFSVAGLRKGLAGKRGNLTLEFAGLAQRLRPRWLVWENVPGVLSADGGRAFGQFLTVLAELGYYAAYRVLDAQHFGVPQRRRRVFLVAYLGDWRPAAAVLFESESLRRNLAPSRKAGQDITQALTRSFGAGGIDDNRAQAGFAVVASLTTKPYADNEAQESGLVVTAEGQTGLPSLTVSNTSKQANNQQPLCVAATPINTQLGLRGPDSANSSREGLGLGNPGDPAFTLQANHGHAVQFGSAVRRLTPLECERLMGYPEEWTRYGVKPNGTQYEVADGPRYQMCGNGWATPVANWVAERVMMVERLLNPVL